MSQLLCCLLISLLSGCFVDGVYQRPLDTIFLRFYTGNDEHPYIDEYLKNIRNILGQIDILKKTVIYIHGFTESIDSSSVQLIVNAYLQRRDHNVLAIDWSELAKGNYFEVVTNVEDVGTHIANAISETTNSNIFTQSLHIVGHSMGAHVAGTIGRKSKFLIPRITGLDPAGPLFNMLQSPLSASDAMFVDIIHTDAGFYGIARTTGTVDFWVNRGIRIQPGCPEMPKIYSVEDFCSHHRSWVFYAESLLRDYAFLAVECLNTSGYSKGNSALIPMGYSTPSNISGSFCLVTSNEPPYGLGQVGARVIGIL